MGYCRDGPKAPPFANCKMVVDSIMTSKTQKYFGKGDDPIVMVDLPKTFNDRQ